MLKSFITSGENLEACEANLLVAREHDNEVAHNRELLTIKQMMEKGFSQTLGRFSWSQFSRFRTCIHVCYIIGASQEEDRCNHQA